MQNQMKALLRQGKAVFSCTIRTPHPNLAEIAGLAGYECVMLDAEHGTVSSDTLDAMILAVRATGATPIVRVPGVDRTLVKQALDHGAGGILFPILPVSKMLERQYRFASTPRRESAAQAPDAPSAMGWRTPVPTWSRPTTRSWWRSCWRNRLRSSNWRPLRPFPASISSTWVPGICPRPMDTPSRPAIPWCCRPWTRP